MVIVDLFVDPIDADITLHGCLTSAANPESND